MKKLALFLALIMVVAACVMPVSAADETKTISFAIMTDDEAKYLVTDASTVTNSGDGDLQYILKSGEQLVYKFPVEAGINDADFILPGLGFYEVYAGKSANVADCKLVYKTAEAFYDGYTSNTLGNNWSNDHKGLTADKYTTAYEPLLEAFSLKEALSGVTTDLYIIVKAFGDHDGDAARTGIWAEANAKKGSIKYVNRRYNLMNNFDRDATSGGAHDPAAAIEGEKYSDGLVKLTYTVAPAAPAPKFVKMLDFDEQYFGTLDTEGHVDGTGCNSFTFKETSGVEVFQRSIENPIDISGCDFVEFYFYCSDITKLDQFTGAQIELCSDGGCDRGEMTFDISGAGLKNRIVGEPQNGWNLVRLDLNAPSAKHTTGGTDAAGKPFDAYNPAHINYFRMYTLEGNKFAGVTMKWDYMYAYAEGETVPAPQKASAQTEAPATDAPTEPVTPPTFDAAASVAVAAVAAMGIVLVASKKRH